MAMDLLFAGIPVSDLAAAIDWYQRLFGKSPDVIVNDDEVMWQLTESGWMYVVRDVTRAGHGLVSFAVADLELFIAEIAKRGIDSPPIEVVSESARKISLTDPDGNRVSPIQVPTGS